MIDSSVNLHSFFDIPFVAEMIDEQKKSLSETIAKTVGLYLQKSDRYPFSLTFIARKMLFGYPKAAYIYRLIQELGFITLNEDNNDEFTVNVTTEQLEKFSRDGIADWPSDAFDGFVTRELNRYHWLAVIIRYGYYAAASGVEYITAEDVCQYLDMNEHDVQSMLRDLENAGIFTKADSDIPTFKVNVDCNEAAKVLSMDLLPAGVTL